MKRGSSLNRILDYYLGIPVLSLLAAFRRRGVYRERPDRVGFLFNPALGDTLLASATVQEVRNLYPDAKLIAFVTTDNAVAASLVPCLDAIEILPITRPLRSIRLIRNCRLDLMLDLTAWQRITAIYTLLSGAAFRIGFERTHQHRHRGYDRAVPHRGDCHEIENLRRITRSLGSRSTPAPRLSIPPGPPIRILAHCERIVVFHAWASGTRAPLREWPAAAWVELAQRLMTPDRLFLLTASPADELRCHSLFEMFLEQGIAARMLIGWDGITEVARVLARAEMLVSVNTGIMHLGAILGAPTIALNGPTAARRWGAFGPRVVNLSPADGSGGFLDLGFEFPRRPVNVMGKITPAQVIEAIHELLSEPRSGGSASLRSRSDADDLHAPPELTAEPANPVSHPSNRATGKPWPA